MVSCNLWYMSKDITLDCCQHERFYVHYCHPTLSIEYTKQRKQFGKPIGSFQLIQSMIGEMIVETQAARLLTYHVAAIMDTGKRKMKETSYAKLFATETAQRVSYKALQIHGVYGYTDDCPVQRFFRDARATTLIEGTSEIQKLSIGRDVLGLSAFV